MKNVNVFGIWHMCDWLGTNGGPPVSDMQRAQIKQIGEKLPHAWSEVAVNNLLTDLRRPVSAAISGPPMVLSRDGSNKAEWEASEVRREVLADIVRRIDLELGTHGPLNAQYNKVLCTGYCVKTSDDNYTGKIDDYQDMVQKCDDMRKAIISAHTLAGLHATETKTLKIFMAPEFFFRGRNGAYDLDNIYGVPPNKGIMEILGPTLEDPIYRDWLFVLGTAIGASEEFADVCIDCGGPVKRTGPRHSGASKGKTAAYCENDPGHTVEQRSQGAIVDNIALIKKGQFFHSVSKELVSHIDYVSADRNDDMISLRGRDLKVQRTPQASGYTGASKTPTKFTDERMGGGVFHVDGITIGLEVCLDHAASTSSSTEGRLNNASNIQIQLVPSAGMTIGKLRTVSGGIIFNVDGSGPHVEVVAGTSKGTDVRFFEGSKSGSEFTLKTSSGNRPSWKSVNKVGVNLNKFKYDGKGTTGPAPRGKVVMYGPYNIPAV